MSRLTAFIVHELVLVAAVALIDEDNRVLLAQRPEGKQLAGLWEFRAARWKWASGRKNFDP